MNKIQEITKDFTIANYKNVIKNPTDEQLEFANCITEKLIIDNDTSKVNTVPAPCGLGKSVLIKSYLKATLGYETFNGVGKPQKRYKGEGFVVVTDLLERFNDYENDKDLSQHCYLMKADSPVGYHEQIGNQFKFPILLISTQKYFKMSEKQREFIFKWKGGDRTKVIFDEKPEFYSTTEINKDFINSIDNAIEAIPEAEDDKDFLNNEIDNLRRYLEEEKRILATSQTDVAVYWKGTRTNISTDNDKFDTLTKKYLSLENRAKIERLKQILSEGAIFINKKGEKADNRRIFFTVNDNRESFYIGRDKAKFWIFDATADIDVEYELDYIDMIKVKCERDYVVNIRNINVSSSRNNLRKRKNIEVLSEYIEKYYADNTFILTYGESLKHLKSFKGSYYGGVKGSNEYRDFKNMIHLGLNRFSDTVYLQTYLFLNPNFYDYIMQNEDKSKEELEKVLEMKSGNFTDGKMNEIMYSKLLVDTEQNIFRTKLRDYSNKELINIDLMYNTDTYSQLNTMLENRLNTDIIIEKEPTEIMEFNKVNTKGNEDLKSIMNYMDNEWDKKPTKSTTIRDILDIAKERWKYLTSKDVQFKDILKSRRITLKKKSNQWYFQKY